MGSPDSWIDPAEISGLAGEIFPTEKPESDARDLFVPLPLLADDDPDADSEELGETLSIERIAGRLRQIRERAERSGLLAGVGDGGSGASQVTSGCPRLPEPFLLPVGCLSEQVRALAGWLSGWGGQVFVLDELGDELAGREVSAGLRSGAVRLALSWERSQPWLREDHQAAGAPLVAAALADGRVMSVVGLRGGGSFYCAALIGESMITVTHARLIQEALSLVFS
jgi:hypothetical protein